jgi:exodeoxyribonuclease VII small subunit
VTDTEQAIAPAAADDPAATQGNGTTPNADIPALPFDKALAELQAVVGRLEAGGLQLEESIALYERGVALHDHCSTLLTGAELRVQRLVEGAGGSLRTIDLRPDDEA